MTAISDAVTRSKSRIACRWTLDHLCAFFVV